MVDKMIAGKYEEWRERNYDRTKRYFLRKVLPEALPGVIISERAFYYVLERARRDSALLQNQLKIF